MNKTNFLPMDELSAGLFTRGESKNGRLTLVSEASTLQFRLQQIYKDAADTGIAIGSGAGRLSRFFLKDTEYRDNELVAWHFENINNDSRIGYVTIFND